MSDIERTVQGGVLELRLNRPAKKNALTLAMYRELTGALHEAEEDAGVRVVLLTAAGDAFCAGNDISDFLAAAGSLDFATAPPMQFVRALVTFDKPLVAAVGGSAVGVGATLLLHCDLVYASERARLSMPFVSLGLVPEAASSALLPARVGHAVASEILLLGAVIDARRALELRLVNEVLASNDELLATARRRASELAAKPPAAVAASRRLLRGDRAAMLVRAEEEGRIFAERLASPEAREAFMAFLERRAPDFGRVS
jgi:enoyl-CoA hydratase/carnithine racemase